MFKIDLSLNEYLESVAEKIAETRLKEPTEYYLTSDDISFAFGEYQFYYNHKDQWEPPQIIYVSLREVFEKVLAGEEE